MARIKRRQSRKIRTHDKAEGVDFVRCAICGKHLRVISGRHLSTHGTDRDTYIEEYRLSPDQLCAKEFRRLHSSRPGYYPHRKRDWIAAIKRIHKRDGQVSSGYIQCKYPHIYNQGLWIFGDWNTGLLAADFNPATVRRRELRDRAKVVMQIRRMRLKHSLTFRSSFSRGVRCADPPESRNDKSARS